MIIYGSALCGSLAVDSLDGGPMASRSFKIYPYQFDTGYPADEVDDLTSDDVNNITGEFNWIAAHGLSAPDFNTPTGVTFNIPGKLWHGKGTDNQQYQEMALYELRKVGNLIILRYDKDVVAGKGSGYAYFYKNVLPSLPE